MKRRPAPGSCSDRHRGDARARTGAAGGARREPKSIRPPKDTGISLRSARARGARIKRARATARLRVGLVALLFAVALIAGWWLSHNDEPAAADAVVETADRADMPGVALEDRTHPTPFFGSYSTLHLYLPVSVDDLTEIAYHQASYDYAQSIDSLLPDADMTQAEENHGSGRTTADSQTTDSGITTLGGSVLRMWRSNRTGPPDTAVDIGAPPGSAVYAPVTGEVVAVRSYMLYDEYEDFEIHIRPNGWSEIEVVMIHVTNPQIAAGDHVVGGVTPIAEIRCLSDRITHQISAYTPDGGDHVHLQLNMVDANGVPVGTDGS